MSYEYSSCVSSEISNTPRYFLQKQCTLNESEISIFSLGGARGGSAQRIVAGQRGEGGCATGKGVEQDDVEAVKWCRKSAEQGLAIAQLHLAEAYAERLFARSHEIQLLHRIYLLPQFL